MITRSTHTASLLLALLSGVPLHAQAEKEPEIPPADKVPILRLEAGGPTSLVTALVFSSDGKKLYGAGWDKAVRVWEWNDAKKEFVLNEFTYRIPIGPGLSGAINAMALSPDGEWLAVAGSGVVRGEAGFRQGGWVYPVGAMTETMLLDEGNIYLIHISGQPTHVLRGHAGSVAALTFVRPPEGNQPKRLVSIGREWAQETGDFSRGRVHLWDIEELGKEKKRSLGDKPLPKLMNGFQPGIAAWHVEGKLQVGIALGDGKFRVWDVNAGKLFDKLEDGKNNNVIAYFSEKRVFTASLQVQRDGQWHGQLQAWTTAAGSAPKADAAQRVLFRTEAPDTFYFPQALTFIASKKGGERDHAAVVLRVPAKGDEYRLHLVDLKGEAKARPSLWKGGTAQPVLAAAPNGRHLAVAGNPDHRILVYSVDDLLAGRDQPKMLQSDGAKIPYVAFVRKGNNPGLLLSESPDPGTRKTGTLIFDFTKLMADDPEAWPLAAPKTDGWKAEPVVKKEKERITERYVTVRSPDGRGTRINLELWEEVTSYALLPPVAPLKTPILALALNDELFQPVLCLHDVGSGARFRHYTGHTGAIRSLAFSDDGKRLVSAADDQTICVWSLSDVDKVLGKRGRLQGVSVIKTKDGNLVVGKVSEDSPFRAALKKGEIIEGLVEGDQLQRLATPADLYMSISRTAPGKAVTLKVAGANRDLKLGQAIDERKPLFTLFLTGARQAAKPEDRDWVGWEPSGPYDASRRDAERYVGWHTNTGDAKLPATFARADQYRAQYYSEGVLKKRIQGDPLDSRKPPPEMTLWLEERGQLVPRDPQGHLLVQQRSLHLRARLDGSQTPLDDLAPLLEWQLDHQDNWTKLERHPGEEEWSADLSKLPWQRGLHTLRVRMRTSNTNPEESQREVDRVLYRPAPPYVVVPRAIVAELLPDWIAPWVGAGPVVGNQQFALRAVVFPGVPGQEIHVRLMNQGQLKEWETAKPLEINEQVMLRAGTNLIEIVAVNKDAPDKELETSRLQLRVTFQKVPAPSIVIDQIVPLLPDGTALDPIFVEANGKVLVHVPTIRILGRITAATDQENLTHADLARNGGPEKPLTKDGKPFTKEGKHKRWDIVEDVALDKVAAYKFKIIAQSDNSDPAEQEVTIEYRPPLPRLGKLELKPQKDKNQFVEGDDPDKVDLKWELVGPKGLGDFEAQVLINGKPLDKPGTLDKQALTLTATVPLRPRYNRLQVRLKNKWGEESTLPEEPVVVEYLRPPRVQKLEKPAVIKEPLVNLTATVHSPLPLTGVDATIKGKSEEVWHHIRDVEITQDKPDHTWRVVLKNVPLVPGDNQVRLWVSNADGRREIEQIIPYAPPRKLEPPMVEITHPADSATTTDRHYRTRFRVKSGPALKRLEVVHRRGKYEQVLFRQPLDVTKMTPVPKTLEVEVGFGAPEKAPRGQLIDLSVLKPNPEGRYEFDIPLQFVPGENRVEVVAVNDDGEHQDSVVIGFTPPPPKVVIDEVRRLDGKGQALKPEVGEQGRIQFKGNAPDARLLLRGRVIWDKDRPVEEVRVPYLVSAYVNGFQQMSTQLEDRQGDAFQRAFDVDLLLNDTDNTIHLEIHGLPKDSNSRSSFELACGGCARRYRLHLLIVGINVANPKALREEALKSLGADPAVVRPGRRFSTRVFDEAYLYGPIINQRADSSYLNREIFEIGKRVQQLQHADPRNDLVMIYYQGGESITAKGHFLHTCDTVPGPNSLSWSAMRAELVGETFGKVPGAHLLLLDVNREEQKGVPEKKTDVFADWHHHAKNGGVIRCSKDGGIDVQIVLDALKGAKPEVTVAEVAAEAARLTKEKAEQLKRPDALQHMSRIPYYLLPFRLVSSR